jgi:hypothetical protein
MVCWEVDVEEEVEASFRGDSSDVTYGNTPASVFFREGLRAGGV